MHRIHPDELDYLLKFYANIIILFIPFIQLSCQIVVTVIRA